MLGSSLSLKKLVERDEAEALKKWGSRDSGGVLGELLGPLLKDKNPNHPPSALLDKDVPNFVMNNLFSENQNQVLHHYFYLA